jgi:hypothetical protein
MIDSDQNDICQYLKSWPGQFVSRREICRRAGGKWRFREDENWAVPVLQRMLETRLVETNSTGHYRLVLKSLAEAKDKKRVWISPAIRAILQKSGRSFPVFDLDKTGDPDDWTRLTSPPTYQLDD